jgi:hypothetical protein
MDLPVVDRTSLSGKYDLTPVHSPGIAVSSESSIGPIRISPPADLIGEIESIGLKLERRKEPVESSLWMQPGSPSQTEGSIHNVAASAACQFTLILRSHLHVGIVSPSFAGFL